MRINKNISEQFKRIKDNPISLKDHVQNCFILFKPLDTSSSGESLFTIYLNNTINFKYVDEFVEKGFSIQHHKIRVDVLDALISQYMESKQFDKIVALFHQNNNPCAHAISMPTRYKQELFNLTYDSQLVFDKKIVLDLFTQNIAITKTDNVEDIIKEHLTILKILYKDGKLDSSDFDILSQDSSINRFQNYFYKPLHLPENFNTKRRKALRELHDDFNNNHCNMKNNFNYNSMNFLQSSAENNLQEFNASQHRSLSEYHILSFINSIYSKDEDNQKKKHYKKL